MQSITSLKFLRTHRIVKYVINRLSALVSWSITLIDAPPLATMTGWQKVGRVFLVTITLVISSLLMAMLAAIVIFVVQGGRAMLTSMPELLSGLEIIVVSACVNTICVMVLLEIKKADHKLIPPLPPSQGPR